MERTRAVALCVLVFMASFSALSLPAAGESEAVNSIAKVLLDFRHVPTEAQKQALERILADKATTAAERVLAEALLNVEHVPSPDDQPRLAALARDASASPGVRTLAAILDNLMHQPTGPDRQKLRRLLRRRVIMNP